MVSDADNDAQTADIQDVLIETYLQVPKQNALVVLPVPDVEPNYRDKASPRPLRPTVRDRDFMSPLLGCPEITIPISEIPYSSRISGREEFLPVSISVIGPPGSDIALLDIMQGFWENSRRPTRVSAGSRAFGEEGFYRGSSEDEAKVAEDGEYEQEAKRERGDRGNGTGEQEDTRGGDGHPDANEDDHENCDQLESLGGAINSILAEHSLQRPRIRFLRTWLNVARGVKQRQGRRDFSVGRRVLA